MSYPMSESARRRVLLFPTCLVEAWRPSVATAAVQLLEQAGCRVEVAEELICCGQPAYNSGDRDTARQIARKVIVACEGVDYVVLPSGSCAGMLHHHLPTLLADDPDWLVRAQSLAARTHELTSFLADVLHYVPPPLTESRTVTYHDSCSGLRELGVRTQPRTLLAAVGATVIEETALADTCCGFGGLFCVKYPGISARLVDDKCARFEATGAQMLVGGDLGCLLNLAGRLDRRGSTLDVRHTAEVLVGDLASPPIKSKDAAP
jgi:L-lactate dehydrogenase complex protein LldE